MAAELRERSQIVVSGNQVSATVSGETVILGLHDGVYYGLDVIATRIWSLAREPRALGAIADTLAAEYDVTRERAFADLVALTHALVARGLLEVLPAHPDS